jgi:hypothetical protein
MVEGQLRQRRGLGQRIGPDEHGFLHFDGLATGQEGQQQQGSVTHGRSVSML